MPSTIPDNFIFQCALYKNTERHLMLNKGFVDDEMLMAALITRQKKESNQILSDLYKQIISQVRKRKAGRKTR